MESGEKRVEKGERTSATIVRAIKKV